MNIGKVSMTMSQIDTTSRVGVEMLSKNIDTMEQAGEGIVKMIDAAAMERSINPELGGNIDLRIKYT